MWAADASETELRENRLQPPKKPPSEGLLLLRQFCNTGIRPKPEKESDLCVKELLYYRILDMFAQVHGIGAEDMAKDRSTLPLIVKLVCSCFLYNT
jgi:hypothetical protein